MAAMAHRSTFSGSAVYIWNHTSFQLYQNFSTHGALAWRHFTMGKKVRRKREMCYRVRTEQKHTYTWSTLVGASGQFFVLVLWSRHFSWCQTLEENQTGITRTKSLRISLWFTSGAKNENSLYGSRPCRPTVHVTGRPLKSIGKPILRWRTTDKVKLDCQWNELSFLDFDLSLSGICFLPHLSIRR